MLKFLKYLLACVLLISAAFGQTSSQPEQPIPSGDQAKPENATPDSAKPKSKPGANAKPDSSDKAQASGSQASGSQPTAAGDTPVKPDSAAPVVDEKPVVTHHQITVNGKTLKYTATVAQMPIRNEDGETEAHIF